MKITAGLGSIDALEAYAAAGADEVFCGYVPEAWTERYGLLLPLNRREVRYAPVQIGSRSNLQLLCRRAAVLGVPVSLTLNALYYIPEQYPLLRDLLRQCAEDGVSSCILADPALLLYLQTTGAPKGLSIHISGEMGACNHAGIALCKDLGASRIIFHRKVALADMASCIMQAPDMEYEAFALNELCHFHGGFCSTVHCDILPHMCKVPYHVGGVNDKIPFSKPPAAEDDPYALGGTGCGLCALWQLQRIGITHLKLVGRGNHSACMQRDIAALKTAERLAATSASEADYIVALRETLLPDGCSRICYYPGQTATV